MLIKLLICCSSKLRKFSAFVVSAPSLRSIRFIFSTMSPSSTRANCVRIGCLSFMLLLKVSTSITTAKLPVKLPCVCAYAKFSGWANTTVPNIAGISTNMAMKGPSFSLIQKLTEKKLILFTRITSGIRLFRIRVLRNTLNFHTSIVRV